MYFYKYVGQIRMHGIMHITSVNHCACTTYLNLILLESSDDEETHDSCRCMANHQHYYIVRVQYTEGNYYIQHV